MFFQDPTPTAPTNTNALSVSEHKATSGCTNLHKGKPSVCDGYSKSNLEALCPDYAPRCKKGSQYLCILCLLCLMMCRGDTSQSMQEPLPWSVSFGRRNCQLMEIRVENLNEVWKDIYIQGYKATLCRTGML